MKASELIAELQALIEKHGDLDVESSEFEQVDGARYEEDAAIGLDGSTESIRGFFELTASYPK